MDEADENELRDAPPGEPSPTSYDLAHTKAYLRLLDADAQGADWREAAEVILQLDCVGNPAHAREVYQAHLNRAQWMAGEGYRHLLQR